MQIKRNNSKKPRNTLFFLWDTGLLNKFEGAPYHNNKHPPINTNKMPSHYTVPSENQFEREGVRYFLIPNEDGTQTFHRNLGVITMENLHVLAKLVQLEDYDDMDANTLVFNTKPYLLFTTKEETLKRYPFLADPMAFSAHGLRNQISMLQSFREICSEYLVDYEPHIIQRQIELTKALADHEAEKIYCNPLNYVCSVEYEHEYTDNQPIDETHYEYECIHCGKYFSGTYR